MWCVAMVVTLDTSELASGGITNFGLMTEIGLAISIVALPLIVILIRTICRGSPFAPLDTGPKRESANQEAKSIAAGSLTLTGLTFAAISFLSTGATGFAISRQTPLGFFVLAFVMFGASFIFSKWVLPWTAYAVEKLRDAGTILLIIAMGALLLDFPGAEAWNVLGGALFLLAFGFFVRDLYSTWDLARN